ncbi:MAG: YggT family protein [Acidimicrobiia bacterium]
MQDILCAIVTVYLVIMGARAVLSWFPPSSSGGGLATVNRLLMDLTEPVLAPLRRIIPPAGMFDLSFMVAFFGLFILRAVICA